MLALDLEAFGKAARWDQLPAPVLALDVQSTATDARFPGALLPAVGEDNLPRWYAVADTGTQWRQLRPLLQAYVGRTLTDFSGEPVAPDLSVPAERLLVQSGAAVLARLTPGAGCSDFAAKALDRLRRALALRPTGAQARPEPTSSLLARLEMSLAVGARSECTVLFGQLRSELRLDTLNLHFVEVRIHSVFREWHALVANEWFGQLCHARKPAAVAGAMLEALWHARLAAFDGEPARLIREYHDAVQSLAQPLLPQAALLQSPALNRLRALALHDRSGAPHDLEPAEVASEGEVAQELLEQALEAPSVHRLADAQAAIDVLSQISRATLLESAAGRQALAEVHVLHQPAPTDWPGWLAALSDPHFEAAAAVAREAATTWPMHGALGEQASAFAHQLLEIGFAKGLACDRLRESLPSLVHWVKEDPEYPRVALRGVYEALLQLFALLERRDGTVREAAADLFDAILGVGSTLDEYRRLLADFSLLIDEGAGASSVYWLIDLAAILLNHPCPDTNARLVLLNRMLDSIQPLLGGLTVGQRAAYNRIASSVAWPTLASPVAGDRAFTGQFTGKVIAIYTLTESAGKQAAAALESMFEGVRVELSHDHVATPRLVRLSREADVFVLTAASAKHAATDCILAHRDRKILLHAAGRGFSSIVRAVEEHAQAH